MVRVFLCRIDHPKFRFETTFNNSYSTQGGNHLGSYIYEQKTIHQ